MFQNSRKHRWPVGRKTVFPPEAPGDRSTTRPGRLLSTLWARWRACGRHSPAPRPGRPGQGAGFVRPRQETGDSRPGKNTHANADAGLSGCGPRRDGGPIRGEPSPATCLQAAGDHCQTEVSLHRAVACHPTVLPPGAQVRPTDHNSLNTSPCKFTRRRWPAVPPPQDARRDPHECSGPRTRRLGQGVGETRGHGARRAAPPAHEAPDTVRVCFSLSQKLDGR